MKLTHMNAIAMAAALTIAAGCSDNASTGEPLPAPSRSTEAAGNTVPSPQQEDDVQTPREAEQTEFAALDTDSSGTLEEDEWESDQAATLEGVKNMTFAQLDRNKSGGIEPDEFRKARTAGGDDASAAADSAIGESEPEEEPQSTGS